MHMTSSINPISAITYSSLPSDTFRAEYELMFKHKTSEFWYWNPFKFPFYLPEHYQKFPNLIRHFHYNNQHKKFSRHLILYKVKHIISRGQRGFWEVSVLWKIFQYGCCWFYNRVDTYTVAFVFQLLEFNTNCKPLRIQSVDCISFRNRRIAVLCGILHFIQVIFRRKALVSVGSLTGFIFATPSSHSSILKLNLNQLLWNQAQNVNLKYELKLQGFLM